MGRNYRHYYFAFVIKYFQNQINKTMKKHFKQMNKIVLTCAVMLLSISTLFSQNGGQANENASVKMEFVSVIGNITTLKITNKQTCVSEIQTKAGGVTIIKSYNPLSSDTVKFVGLTGTSVKFQSKALTNCGATDFGQVELTLNINDLPVRFGRITIRPVNSK